MKMNFCLVSFLCHACFTHAFIHRFKQWCEFGESVSDQDQMGWVLIIMSFLIIFELLFGDTDISLLEFTQKNKLVLFKQSLLEKKHVQRKTTVGKLSTYTALST